VWIVPEADQQIATPKRPCETASCFPISAVDSAYALQPFWGRFESGFGRFPKETDNPFATQIAFKGNPVKLTT